MTDKEFKHLRRSELVEIIYRLQLDAEKLKAENRMLKEQLADRKSHIQKAGSVAEAALLLNNVFDVAQAAADDYLHEIESIRTDTVIKCRIELEAAKDKAQQIISDARQRAESIKDDTAPNNDDV